MSEITLDAKPVAKSTASPVRYVRRTFNYITVTGVSVALLCIFLSPFLFMVFTSLKTPEQMSQAGAPLWPAKPAVFTYEGKELEVYIVPMPDGSTRNLAAVKKLRQVTTFVDPSNPGAGTIDWQGSWRTLKRPWEFAPTWSNFPDVWEIIDFPILLRNTAFLAIMTELGVLISCTLVAYGFARFRFPGRDLLFIILISTIFLPGFVTLIPTYTFFSKIGWVGTYLPLIVPAFFANAYDVFLLRQYFLTLPMELDEAAMIDGAGPFRILWSVILPQSTPVLVAVTVFHIVWAWNEFFGPLIYLTTRPDLQPISVAISRFNGIYGSKPTYIQAAALMAIVIPLVLFFLAQRFFIQGIVISGVEK